MPSAGTTWTALLAELGVNGEEKGSSVLSILETLGGHLEEG